MKKITSISLFIFFAIVTAVLTAGLVFYQDSKNINTNALNTNINNTDITPGGIMVLDLIEVAKHNTNTNCWIIVNSKVYNISNYASSHPGGTRNILDYCGKEATVAFDTKGNKGQPHSTSANNMLDQYFVGNLNQDVSQSTINTSTQNAQVNNTNTNKGGDYEDDD
jgi:cytochrome b involved in lipid metabolism